MSTLSAGDVFAGYTVERQLGAGGMGEVYLARHPRLPRRDALKILAAQLSGDQMFRTRFEREADVVARLSHPHIVDVVDRGEHDGRLWIAYEFIDGRDLAELLSAEPLPGDFVGRVIGEVASALDYAASHGLVHRDVKPANILVDQLGRAHLTDFGIARTADDQTDLTATGTTIGTVAYASPEQLQGLTVDPRSDQYSLAATAFALLTGTIVYPASNAMAVSIAHARQEIPAASSRRPGIPPAVDQVLAHALAKDPAQRFPSSSAFAQALSATLAGAPAPVFVSQLGRQGVAPAGDPNASAQHAPTQRPLVPGPPGQGGQAAAPRKPFWRRLPVVAAALVLVAALAAGTFILWPEGEERSADINAFDPQSAPKLAAEAANLEPVLVTPNLPSLETKPAQAVWSYSPDADTRWQVIGGTEEFALAAGADYGRTHLAVLSADSGRALRTMDVVVDGDDGYAQPGTCVQFPGTDTLFCQLGRNIGPDNQQYGYAAVDLVRGSVSAVTQVSGGYTFAITGDRAVVVSESEVVAFDATGREVWRAAGEGSYDLVNGSPVVEVSDATGFTLRKLSDGSVVYHARKDADDVEWSPYLDGYAVQEGDGVDFYDRDGTKKSRLPGWGVLETSGYLAQVTALPIVTSGRQAVGAVDPASGTLLWQQPAPAWNSTGGVGTVAVFRWTENPAADDSETTTYWLDCYTGVGGRLPPGYAGSGIGTDGTRLALGVSVQEGFGFAVGDPMGSVLWELPSEQSSEIYQRFGDKVYFGPRRVL